MIIFIDEEKYKDLSGIYQITQVSKGKVYIGQTKMRFIKRYWHHKWKLNDGSHDNQHLLNAWNKYGEGDFAFEILHILDKNEDMNEWEMSYIDELNSYRKGFNMTVGGEGKKGAPMSEEARRIVGEKNREHNLGKRHSEETKRKMSKSRTGKKMTKTQKESLLKSRIGSTHTKEARIKMREKKLGSRNKVSKIDENQAYEIKVRIMDDEAYSSISRDMGIPYGIVRSVGSNIVWQHVDVCGWDNFLSKRKKKFTLTDNQVREIRRLLNTGILVKDISKELNIGVSTVSAIKNGRTYKYVK